MYPTHAHSAEAPVAYAIPVTPSRSQALRPDTTAERATTRRFIFRPPTKKAPIPDDE